ncbi:MAG TPA: hypothetical protein VEH84_18875 [Alphaproteobacteria bacterium]|nr:hypothetical protein [Alphaproteobacteria bacterium]
MAVSAKVLLVVAAVEAAALLAGAGWWALARRAPEDLLAGTRPERDWAAYHLAAEAGPEGAVRLAGRGAPFANISRTVAVAPGATYLATVCARPGALGRAVLRASLGPDRWTGRVFDLGARAVERSTDAVEFPSHLHVLNDGWVQMGILFTATAEQEAAQILVYPVDEAFGRPVREGADLWIAPPRLVRLGEDGPVQWTATCRPV